MTTFVLDASAFLAWALPNQRTLATGRFFLAAENDEFVAPHIFDWEVGNVLLSLRRRGVLSGQAFAEVLADSSSLVIDRRPALTSDEIDDLMTVAGGMGLSLFDAAYLTLARSEGARLVSRDRQLLNVARTSGLGYVNLVEDVGL